jgi:hypothetical protein
VLSLVAPEILEARWRELGIAHGVLDIFVPEIILDRSCVVTIACQLVAGSMAQHVSMDLEREVGFLPCPLDQPIEGIRSERSAAFAHKHKL